MAFSRILSASPASRWIARQARRTWAALQLFGAIDGSHRAAAFAYFAFFAVFPLIVVLVMIGSIFFDYQHAASSVMDTVSEYIPSISRKADSRGEVFGAVQTVLNSRRSASLIAIGIMLWSALGFFDALVRAVNHAWDCGEFPWYRMPLKNLTMFAVLGTAMLIGLLAPLLLEAFAAILRHWLPPDYLALRMALWIGHTALPLIVLFYGFIMFFKLAPKRHTTFAEVWSSALTSSLLLLLLQRMFVLYASNIGNFNKFYGALGGVLAVLMWIYLSGCVIIFGACLCAAQYPVIAKNIPEAHPQG